MLDVEGAVAGYFHYVFAGEAVWCAIERDDDFVEDFFLDVVICCWSFLILFGEDDLAEGEGVGLAGFKGVRWLEGMEDLATCDNGIRTADANDGNSSYSLRCGDGTDCILMIHIQNNKPRVFATLGIRFT